ncbi:MAG: redoxin domain-containing protein [Rhodothermaceae bacterium]|nr:redoxin domain-containing protein [Rhodothermaceae bacterium]
MMLRHGLSVLLLTALLLGCENEMDQPHDGLAAEAPLEDSSALRLPDEPDDAFSEDTLAPPVRLSGPEGDFVLADERGRIVVLNFWATWNELSQDGLASLDTLAQELADEVLVVGITEDEDPEMALGTWLEANTAPTFALLADPAQTAAHQFGDIELLPTTIVIDREGMVRARHTGILSHDALLDLLGPILIEDDEPLAILPAMPRGTVQPIAAEEVPPLIARGAMLVDVRLPDERDQVGALPHAQHRPLSTLLAQDLPANFAMPVIFVCGEGVDSDAAAQRALTWGYMAVYVVAGGVPAWADAGLPLEPRASTASEQSPVLPERTVLG